MLCLERAVKTGHLALLMVALGGTKVPPKPVQLCLLVSRHLIINSANYISFYSSAQIRTSSLLEG